MQHREVLNAAARWLSNPFQRAVMRECGLPTYDRADIVAFDVATNDVRIVEVKASVADARHLLEQLERYRPWCDYLYVAVPEALSTTIPQLPKGVGLIVARYSGQTIYGRLVRRPRRSTMDDEHRRKMQRRTLTWLLAFYTKGMIASKKAWTDGDEWTPGEALRAMEE
ncbi:hypothetical protein LCGC14_1966020 [marine sediment metagenome]|uniref:Uncharacterized protein n=1 Tax=marine sediment metagenome TaxID=412755 RepID=A0A0F9FD65_9ZZZZ